MGPKASMGRLARWWHANAPTRESLEDNRFIAPVAHRVLEPSLWRFTRRSDTGRCCGLRPFSPPAARFILSIVAGTASIP